MTGHHDRILKIAQILSAVKEHYVYIYADFGVTWPTILTTEKRVSREKRKVSMVEQNLSKVIWNGIAGSDR